MPGAAARIIICRLIDPNVMQIVSECEADVPEQALRFLLAAQPDAAVALMANL